jgi:hypothetical protein
MEKEIKLDALKLIAESYGFELVEKAREIKVGDFGKFWDNDEDPKEYFYDFLLSIIDNRYKYRCKSGGVFKNFAHLTDEEKKQIQENW